jgi:diguanylate cyclase (GGDEF)-like protein
VTVSRHGQPEATAHDATRARAGERPDGIQERRRASRLLWTACEALLSAASDPRALERALDALVRAFDCDGASLHVLGARGDLERSCTRGPWERQPGDLRAAMSMPLSRGEEHVGTLELLARPGQRWTPAHHALLRTAAGALGAALGARLELSRLRQQPGRDTVTGLPDARAFHARLAEEAARAAEHGVPLAVLELDLDHFAALNSKYGRPTGDRALAEAALVLKLALRDGDYIARLGGDAFGILLPETDVLPARRVAERLRRTLEEHRFARVGRLSVSTGVVSSPRDGVDPLELMNAVDQALGLAKKGGRRRVVTRPRANVH